MKEGIFNSFFRIGTPCLYGPGSANMTLLVHKSKTIFQKKTKRFLIFYQENISMHLVNIPTPVSNNIWYSPPLTGSSSELSVFIQWMLTLTRILNILTWPSRNISHNMLLTQNVTNFKFKHTINLRWVQKIDSNFIL